MKVKSLSRIQLFVTPWTVAYRASPSMEFSRQEYWSGLPFTPPGDLPNPGIEPGLLHCRQTLYCLSHQESIRTYITYKSEYLLMAFCCSFIYQITWKPCNSIEIYQCFRSTEFPRFNCFSRRTFNLRI